MNRGHLKDSEENGKITLKWISEKQVVRVQTGWTMVGFGISNIQPSGSITRVWQYT